MQKSSPGWLVQVRKPLDGAYAASAAALAEGLGDYAFEWGMYHHVYYNNDEPDKIIEERGKVMRILRRQADGKWKVTRAIWTD